MERTARAAHALRALCVVALALSAAAASDYYGHGHAFCAAGSGCDAVRTSALGRQFGFVLPALGMVGFGIVLVASLARRPSVRMVALAATAGGGVLGALLLLAQTFVIRRICALCAGVDLAALLAALCALALVRTRDGLTPPSARARRRWFAAALLAAVAPPAWSFALPPQPPPWVVRMQAPGKLNVIEVSDFECPFCRAMHPVLKRALAPYGKRVHFVRIPYPLPGHEWAHGATLAYLCADAQGRAEEMADFLFSSDDLSVPKALEHAVALGLDRTSFVTCLHDPGTERAIAWQMALVRSGGFEGLPVVYIAGRALLGYDDARGAARYSEALEVGEHGRPPWLPLAPWFALAVGEAILLWPTRSKPRPG